MTVANSESKTISLASAGEMGMGKEEKAKLLRLELWLQRLVEVIIPELLGIDPPLPGLAEPGEERVKD